MTCVSYEYFNAFNKICLSFSFTLHPKQIVIDFEKTIHNARDLIWAEFEIVRM